MPEEKEALGEPGRPVGGPSETLIDPRREVGAPPQGPEYLEKPDGLAEVVVRAVPHPQTEGPSPRKETLKDG